MSSNSDSGPGQREIAYRLFAAEYDDATLDHSESDEERAPNYVVTPTGARVNRLFAVGVLTEVESVNEDVLRARFVDPTGAFVAYAGQYQPDAVAFLENTGTPEFVALAGKARTFQPEDSDHIYTSVRPESVNAVDADTRDRWVVSAAEATLRRVATFADALAMDERGDDLREALTARGVDPSLASGISLAIDHYGTTTAYLDAVRGLAVDALEVVAGDREQVRSLDLAPDEGGEAELGPLPADASGVAAVTASPATDGTEPETTEATPETTTETAEADTDTAGAAVEGDDAATESESGTGTAETAAPTQMEEMAETEPAGTETDATETPETEAGTGAADESESEPADEATAAGADESPTAEAAATEPEPESELATAEADADADAGGLGEFEDVGGGDETTAAAESDETAASAASTDAGAGADASAEAEAEAEGEGSPAGVDEAEMYEFDEEERREIEEEFGTDFSTGTEVDAPGEADIETPAAEAESGDPAATEAESESESESGTGTAETAAPTQMEEMAETEPAGTETDATEASETEAGTGAADESEPADEATAAGADESTESESESESAEPATAEADADEEAAAADVDLEDAVVDAMDDIDDGDGADREAVVAAVVDEYGVDPGEAEDAIDDALMNGQCYEPAEGRLKAI